MILFQNERTTIEEFENYIIKKTNNSLEGEAKNLQEANRLSIPSPKFIEVNNNLLKMEKIEGLLLDFKSFESYIDNFCNLHKKILFTKSPKLVKFEDIISTLKIMPNEIKEIFLTKYNSIPKQDSFCHGDYQPNNIIIGDDQLYVIDFESSFSGHPMLDVCMTYIYIFIHEKYGKNFNSSLYNLYMDKMILLFGYNIANIRTFLLLASFFLPEIERLDILNSLFKDLPEYPNLYYKWGEIKEW